MSKSAIIYKGRDYTACAMNDGSLCVSRNRTQRGVRLLADAAPEWIDAIKNAIDDKEREDLCRGMFS